MYSNRNMIGMLSALIKSIYVNIRLFPIRIAIKLPVIVGWNVHIKGLRKGAIVLQPPIKTKMCSLGRGNGSGEGGAHKHSYLNIGEKGVLHIANKFYITSDFHLLIYSRLYVGENFFANHGFRVICRKNIQIGTNCMFGWDVSILDNDGHDIFINDAKKDTVKSVIIGDNVWIGSKSTILKGTSVGCDSVVGFGALVSGNYPPESIIANQKAQAYQYDKVKWTRTMSKPVI